ncbi:hypothetical protein [Bradyrhizobium sp. USDA 4508]
MAYAWLQRVLMSPGKSRRRPAMKDDADLTEALLLVAANLAPHVGPHPKPLAWVEAELFVWRNWRIYALLAAEICRQPTDNRLESSTSWKRLLPFQTSAKEDGLKWLLQRRNLVVHSLHLHPVGTEDEGVFKSQFNHLDAAHREKLRPREPNEEVALLMGQLAKASRHFNDFLDIVELTPSRKRESYL